MGKQSWKAGNMLYPVPAVMVSCKRAGEKPNIITVAHGMLGAGNGIHISKKRAVFA